MTEIIQAAGTTLIGQTVSGALFLLVCIGMGWIIKIMLDRDCKYQKQMETEREEHRLEMLKLFEATEKLSEQNRQDSKEREEQYRIERESLLTELGRFNQSLQSLSILYQDIKSDLKEIRCK